MRSVQAKGWVFEYGAGAYTYRDKKLITIRSGASALNMAAQFSHEIGHANFNYRPDLSSREAFVRWACTDEGHGLIENIVAHRAMKECASMNMGVVSADPDWFLATYEEMLQSAPVNVPTIGYMFCERNHVPTGETYLDYYGNWYDANHGALVTASVADPEPVLWNRIDAVVEAGRWGGPAMRKTWPLSAPSDVRISSVLPVGTRRAGPASLSATVSVLSSEVRVDSNDDVTVVSMSLEGRCVTRQEVKKHYPMLEISQPPSPHGPPRTVWSARGEWGELMFAFEADAPDCVDTISLAPTIPSEKP
jgi:hypothetical protein